MKKVKQKVIASFFSQDTNLYYKLFETPTWPVLELSGYRMNYCGKISCEQATLKKISFLQPVKGTVLDTCAGLGYTAIQLAKLPEVKKVISLEFDSNIIELAKLNPFSKELFVNSKIKLIHADIFSEIKTFPDSCFDAIMHDAPTIKTAGMLYSNEFYSELFRVLKPGYKLFHFTGSPGSKSKGIDVRDSIMKRLSKIGFSNIQKTDFVKGITCVKPI